MEATIRELKPSTVEWLLEKAPETTAAVVGGALGLVAGGAGAAGAGAAIGMVLGGPAGAAVGWALGVLAGSLAGTYAGGRCGRNVVIHVRS